MARRKNSFLHSMGRGFAISTARHSLPPLSSLFSRPVPIRPLDGRLFNPLPLHRAQRVISTISTFSHSRPSVKTRYRRKLHSRDYFQFPRSVVACARRSERREVMFAKSFAGRRFGSGGSVRRTFSSNFSCRGAK